MDMMKMGNFLAALRKEQGLTQEELGEKLGVTNKTISRWETGTYMPPVEMLQELGDLYRVSMNELVSGQRLSSEDYATKAEENLKEALKSGAFSFKERIAFHKKKWRKDHVGDFVCGAFLWMAVLFACRYFHVEWPLMFFIGVVLAILLYGYWNNQMMIYVEKKAFD